MDRKQANREVSVAMTVLSGGEGDPALAMKLIETPTGVCAAGQSTGSALETWIMLDALLSGVLQRLDVEAEVNCPVCQPNIARIRAAFAALDRDGALKEMGSSASEVVDYGSGRPGHTH